MNYPAPVHGGTDAGPEPRFDFSSNANPLGPCPSVLAAIRTADLRRYPDPDYTALRHQLAAHHGVGPDQIVVGAGASELILRLIRHIGGPVRILAPTFSEYARGARLARVRTTAAHDPAGFLRLHRRGQGLGFVCWPNNPTGDGWSLDFIREAARLGPLVVDLAYAPLCADGELAQIEAASSRAIRLYAPNKSFGLTGLRAAYAILPRPGRGLARLAPAWVLGRAEEAFLGATIQPESLRWLAESRPRIFTWRQRLAAGLRARSLAVREGPATYLLVRVGPAGEITRALRTRGVRVRDATSFGLPDWLRLSAQAPAAQKYLFTQLDALGVANTRP